MARRRRSKEGSFKPRKLGTEDLMRQKYMGLATSGPLNAPRFGFITTKLGKLDVCVFYSKFAAKKFLSLMIADDEIEWIDDKTIYTSNDMTIHSDQLKQIYNHHVTYNEERYHTFSEFCLSRVALMRNNQAAKPLIPGSSISTRRRSSRKGMVLMKTIAEELNMTPREARGILRGVMSKPDHGWAWRTADEVNRIKAILSGKPNQRTLDFSKAEINAVEQGVDYRPLAFRVRGQGC